MDPKLLISLVSYHLKMVLINTHAVVTHVVDLFLPRNKTVLVSESYNVNSNCLSVKRHPRVSTTTTSPRMGTLPDVTGTGCAVDHETSELNDDIRHDLVLD